MAKTLLKAWPTLWTFANHEGVKPPNNHAERALRNAVIYRKLSLGSQSERVSYAPRGCFGAHHMAPPAPLAVCLSLRRDRRARSRRPSSHAHLSGHRLNGYGFHVVVGSRVALAAGGALAPGARADGVAGVDGGAPDDCAGELRAVDGAQAAVPVGLSDFGGRGVGLDSSAALLSISLTERVPGESTVRKLTRRIGAEPVSELTRALIVKATREKRSGRGLCGSTRP
jgi:transposase IS66 family protein